MFNLTNEPAEKLAKTLIKMVEVYDPAQDLWAQKDDIRIPRGGHGTIAVNGRIYVIGGANAYSSHALDGGFAPIPTIEVYNLLNEK